MFVRHLVPVSLAALALGLAMPSAHAQQILQNFTGSTISNSKGYIPPDTQGAAGLSSYVEMVNNRYAVYSSTGNALNGTPTATQSSSLDAFWQNAGVTPIGAAFDPRIVYDPTAQRFYASALDFGPKDAAKNNNSNDILLAVSKSSDPTRGWSGILIPGTTPTDHFFVDYDTLGYNGDGVYVAVNNFGSSASADGPVSGGSSGDAPANPGESILVVPKASLAAQTTNGTSFFYNNDYNSTGFTAHPVVDQDSVNGFSGTEYLLSAFSDTTNKLSSITGTAAMPTLNTSGGFVMVTARTDPPTASQPNGDNTIDAGDTRFDSSVVKVKGELWGVQDISVNGHAGLNLVRMNAATGQVISETQIADPAHDYYYGSVAVNGQGQLVVGYTRSGSTEFASSYASVGTYTATSVTFADPLLLKAGGGDYDIQYGAGRNRFGDYSETTVDPNDPSKFWTVQEWASGLNTTSGPDHGAWSTQITEIGLASAPEPSSLAAIGIGVFALVGCIARKRRAQSA